MTLRDKKLEPVILTQMRRRSPYLCTQSRRNGRGGEHEGGAARCCRQSAGGVFSRSCFLLGPLPKHVYKCSEGDTTTQVHIITVVPALKTHMFFFFRPSLTRGIVFKIPETVTRLPRGQRRRNLRQKTRHCSRNTRMSRKRRKRDHHTAAGG